MPDWPIETTDPPSPVTPKIKTMPLGGELGELVDVEPRATAMVLSEREWQVLASICEDHLRNHRVTIEERKLCDRIIKAGGPEPHRPEGTEHDDQ